MIKIFNDNGVYAPVLLCDFCGGIINESEKAVVVSLVIDGKKEKTTDAFCVHKGICQKGAEIKLSEKGRVGWQELDTHFYFLFKNMGLPIAKLKKLENEEKNPHKKKK